MTEYYSVLDMTPSDVHLKDYNRVGLAPKNQVDVIGTDMVDEAAAFFANVEHIIAVVILISIMCIIVITYHFCKAQQ